MKRLWMATIGITILFSGAVVGWAYTKIHTKIPTKEACQFNYFYDCGALPAVWDTSQPIMQTITEATNCKPVLVHPKEDADAKLNLMMNYENLPDLITTGNTELLKEMIDKGLVWELEEFLQTYLPDSHLLKDYPQDVKAALTARDGGWYSYASHIASNDADAIWGVPDSQAEYLEGLKYANQFSIFFRTEYLVQLGINVKDIDTEEKLLETLQLIAEAELKNEAGQSVFPLMIHGNQYQTFTTQALEMHFGVLPVERNGNYQSIYYNKNYKHVMSFLNRCAQKGYITESMIAMDEPTFIALCDDGRVACYIGGLYALHGNLDADWCTPGPVQSSMGDRPVFGLPYELVASTGWLQTVVSKQTEYPEEIAVFLDYMTSREGMLVHMYGIEGEDYYWDKNNLLHRTEAGAAKVEDCISGMQGFWGFHYGSFSNSVQWVDLSEVSDIRTAFGTSDKVYLYDLDLLSYPVDYVSPDSKEAYIANEVKLYAEQVQNSLLFAEDDVAFEEMYTEFLDQLDRLGLRRYDSYIDKAIQKNYETYGEKIVDINERDVFD